jgi:sugar/nucleoside kinase (ribokinase family)
MADILVVGSLAYDSISTPEGNRDHILGGSANYFSVGASLFTKIQVVGVVGEDYSADDLKKLEARNVDVSGLEKVSGKTFHWKGEYKEDMNEAITHATELNVFQDFDPKLPESYKDTDCVFLANIDPELQLKVLSQVNSPKLVACDTMNLWIDIKLDTLKEVLKRVHVLLINETEALMLTKTRNAIAASQEILKMGPEAVVVKRGEYGCLLRKGDEIFMYPAYPLPSVKDPTGAGDTFAGGFLGSLAKSGLETDMKTLKRCCLYGGALAAYTVEGFGLESLEKVTTETLESRVKSYENLTKL